MSCQEGGVAGTKPRGSKGTCYGGILVHFWNKRKGRGEAKARVTITSSRKAPPDLPQGANLPRLFEVTLGVKMSHKIKCPHVCRPSDFKLQPTAFASAFAQHSRPGAKAQPSGARQVVPMNQAPLESIKVKKEGRREGGKEGGQKVSPVLVKCNHHHARATSSWFARLKCSPDHQAPRGD